MKHLFALILLMPGILAAEEIYKCTDPAGNVSFQRQACQVEQGTAERMQLPEAPTTSWQSTPQEPEAEYSRQLDQLRQAQEQRDYQYQDRIRKIDQQHCQYYKDKLADVQQRWQTIKRSGYKQSERDYWEDRIDSRARDMQRECN